MFSWFYQTNKERVQIVFDLSGDLELNLKNGFVRVLLEHTVILPSLVDMALVSQGMKC